MIDKATAFTIAGNDYRLCDKEWKEYVITEADFGGFTLGFGGRCYYSQIGADYFILAHPMENLTKDINGVVHIVELAKISGLINRNFETIKSNHTGVYCQALYTRFFYNIIDNYFYCVDMEDLEYDGVKNQLELFNYLNKNHFSHLLPEGSWKEIKL